MKKFTIDPKRLAAYEAASESAYFMARDAKEKEMEERQKLTKLLLRQRKAEENTPAHLRREVVEGYDKEIGALRESVKELTAASVAASDNAQHHGRIAESVTKYAKPYPNGFHNIGYMAGAGV